MSKEIQLTQNKTTIVDDSDFEYLNQIKWRAHNVKGVWYAVSGSHKNTISMHRLLMCTPYGLVVDHIDHNTLNNQRFNLRNCSVRDNCRNRIAKSKTGYKGVYYSNNKIIAQITPVNHKPIHLGNFKTLEEAAKKYNEAAIKYFGEFANLNIIKDV